ncbi:4'-phosphopantetheinyl transferase family protein [Ornithinimicrobium sp. LYQ121]|uniref:4'-phosphopantetheinyl transferase family protein n=1 Tax=Ornithinimicrobium sp. LYQ121 TaxID=3378801 RepID=UPI003853863D
MSEPVAWHPAGADPGCALRGHVLDVLGPGGVEVGRLCPACGSARHGHPWARHTTSPAGGVREVHVSLSRAGDHLVTAVSLAGPVGVDVELVADVASRWQPELVLSPGEDAGSAEEMAWLWCAKEAVLKRRGTGLTVPMTEVRLVDEAGVTPLQTPVGLTGALASGNADPARSGLRQGRQ